MNWTGGHLNRHSKANSNTLLKSQKRHFAKARLREQGTSSPSRSSFSIHAQHQPALPINQRGTSKHIRKLHAELDKLPQSKIQSILQPKFRGNPTTNLPSERQPQHSQPKKEFGINHLFKETLLSQRDWAGLRKTRPMKSSWNSGDADLGQVQERVSESPVRHQWSRAAARNLSSPSHSPIFGRHTDQNSSLLDAQGSHPPPSQARSVSNPTADFPGHMPRKCTTFPSYAPEREFCWNHTAPAGHEARIHKPISRMPQMDLFSKPLIPLNKLLSLRSFDEVMELSSSLATDNSSPGLFQPLEDVMAQPCYQQNESCFVGYDDCPSTRFSNQNGEHSDQNSQPVSLGDLQPATFPCAPIRRFPEEYSSPPQIPPPSSILSQHPRERKAIEPRLPTLSAYPPHQDMQHCQTIARQDHQVTSEAQNWGTEVRLDPASARLLPSSPSSKFPDGKHRQQALNPAMKRKASDHGLASSCRPKRTAVSSFQSSIGPGFGTSSMFPLPSHTSTLLGDENIPMTLWDFGTEIFYEF
ncbi:hypothetical protein PV10_01450 [Exophiala mesophila]|uniref:Uncharacterized protein n=1 Tax=Exophiala mesophila TaxID=212818 RepID=A0A0D1X7B0_EXOME|nr:uncharacterized protein PV10_01450 [Exophiala mesophila]KIV97740.1 hypothetical protein PV10_01450 [Exophiala mesophila]